MIDQIIKKVLTGIFLIATIPIVYSKYIKKKSQEQSGWLNF